MAELDIEDHGVLKALCVADSFGLCEALGVAQALGARLAKEVVLNVEVILPFADGD